MARVISETQSSFEKWTSECILFRFKLSKPNLFIQFLIPNTKCCKLTGLKNFKAYKERKSVQSQV